MGRGSGITGRSSSGSSVSSANVGKQAFNATVGQTQFTVTDFTLNVFTINVDGSLQTFGYSNVGNVITFDLPFSGGEEIVVIGIK